MRRIDNQMGMRIPQRLKYFRGESLARFHVAEVPEPSGEEKNWSRRFPEVAAESA